MKIIFEDNVLTLRKPNIQDSHDGTPYIVSIDIILNGKKVAVYGEDFWCGPCHINIISNQELLQKIANRFLNKYPQGVFPLMGVRAYNMLDLYKGEEIEGLFSEIAGIYCSIEPKIKKILRNYPIAVIAKDSQRTVEQFWKVPNEEAMKNFEGKIIVMKAYKEKENFTFEL